MADKKVNIKIALQDATASGLSKIKAGFNAVGDAAQRLYFITKTIKSGIEGIVGAFAGVAKGITSAIQVPLQKAFDFETIKTRLGLLTGSVTKGTQAFKELWNFAKNSPFELSSVIEAQRTLKLLSEGALGTSKDLTMIGDAAAKADKDIVQIANALGKAYTALKSGEDFKGVGKQLHELGVISTETFLKIAKMQEAGASVKEMTDALKAGFKESEGSMKAFNSTGNGLIKQLKDTWSMALATFGEEFVTLAKDKIKLLIDVLDKLTKSGTIQKWAEQASEALGYIIEAIKIVTGGTEKERTEMFSLFGGIITAAFVDAITVAAELFMVYAPRIGSAIGSAIKDTMSFFGQDYVDRQQAKENLGYGPFAYLDANKKAQIDAEQERIRVERERNSVDKAVSIEDSRLPKALEAFRSYIDKNKKTDQEWADKIVDGVTASTDKLVKSNEQLASALKKTDTAKPIPTVVDKKDQERLDKFTDDEKRKANQSALDWGMKYVRIGDDVRQDVDTQVTGGPRSPHMFTGKANEMEQRGLRQGVAGLGQFFEDAMKRGGLNESDAIVESIKHLELVMKPQRDMFNLKNANPFMDATGTGSGRKFTTPQLSTEQLLEKYPNYTIEQLRGYGLAPMGQGFAQTVMGQPTIPPSTVTGATAGALGDAGKKAGESEKPEDTFRSILEVLSESKKILEARLGGVKEGD